MKKLGTIDDLKNFIKENEIALVAFLDMTKPDDVYFRDVLLSLERKAGYMISFAVMNINENSNAHKFIQREFTTPLIMLYVKGVKAFEQEGCFGEFLSDIAALKQGIKDVLKSKGYKTLF